jgi:hypothetical protein
VKKFLGVLGSALLLAIFATPAHATVMKYSVYQKTLSAFSSTATALTAQQKAQVKAAVDANPAAEKFICTGIRYFSQPMSVNIMVRKRAKAACEYAKQLNPELSTWYQNKPTQARSYAGKVLLTIKSPEIARASLRDLDQPNAVCQIQETSNKFFNSKGFPFQSLLPATGEVDIAIVPIDFSNAPGVGNPGTMYADDVKKIEEWAPFASSGNMSYDVDLVSTSWIRAPRGAEWYTHFEGGKSPVPDLQSRTAALQELISVADNSYDFTETEFVYFVFPYKAEQQFGTAVYLNYKVPIETKDGTAELTAYGEMGGYNNQGSWSRSRIWEHVIHEILHYQGFVGHGPVNGGNWNIMQNQFGASATTSGWESFLAGWLSEDQVICIKAADISGEMELSLTSIDAGGTDAEVAIVKMSETEVVVIELRNSGKYSSFKGAFSSSDRQTSMPENPGYTAYRVNPNLANYRDDKADQAEVEAKNWWGYLRDQGNAWISGSINHKGLKLTNLSNKTLGLTYIPETAVSSSSLDYSSREPEELAFCSCCGCFPSSALH